MSDPICSCHCGTRITIDEQLLEERETWKQKYYCLQKQAQQDINSIKQNIYAECASLMQKEFSQRQILSNKTINKKNEEIQELTSRIINLEAKVKVSDKQNEILRNKVKSLESQIDTKDKEIYTLKSRTSKGERDWQAKLEEQLAHLRKKLSLSYEEQISKLMSENDHLRHKIKQFQKKYQTIIPEVQKLKNLVSTKSQQLSILQSKMQSLTNESQQKINKLQLDLDEIEKNHHKCRPAINKLSDKVESLTQELENNKKVKKEVRVEPVYIERPVQVEKVIEKIVQVEKVVNKYIEPTNFKDDELEEQNKKLKLEINNIINELHIFEDRYIQAVNDYEERIRQHEQNTISYKKQREKLVSTIQELHQEIDSLQSYLHNFRSKSTPQPEKIIVHVGKDGSYQKTVEKVQSPTSNVSKVPPTKNTRKK